MPTLPLLCSVSALALLFSVPFAAPAANIAVPKSADLSTRGEAAIPGFSTLYNQNNHENPGAVLSSNFTSGSFSDYDSYGADDFVVPPSQRWKIKEVDVTGQYGNGSGFATSENVLIYSDNHGLPGKVVSECDNIQSTGSNGSFAMRIPKTCKVILHGGHQGTGRTYWISVVVNINELESNPWYWHTTNRQNNNLAAWENPGGGLNTGCDTWGSLAICNGDNQGPDFMFALKGTESFRD